MKFISVILSPEAEEVYNYLNERAQESKGERMILKSINQKIELIKRLPKNSLSPQQADGVFPRIFSLRD